MSSESVPGLVCVQDQYQDRYEFDVGFRVLELYQFLGRYGYMGLV